MATFKDWFEEDEDDIFMGSPKSKFFDVSREASKDIVEEEIDKTKKIEQRKIVGSFKKIDEFSMEAKSNG